MGKIKYSEPSEYFPESIRKEFKLGEYAEPEKKTGSIYERWESEEDSTFIRDLTEEEREEVKRVKKLLYGEEE